jgi:hypothetical protein
LVHEEFLEIENRKKKRIVCVEKNNKIKSGKKRRRREEISNLNSNYSEIDVILHLFVQ